MNIVITGCSRGIGLELVKLFSQKHTVYCLSRNITPIEKYKEEIGGSDRIRCLQFDFENVKTDELVSFLKTEKGIDVLINNAGYLKNKPFAQLSEEDLRKMYEVNVIGPFRLIQNLLPLFNKQSAHTINIGSMGGVQGSVKFPGLSAYSSSKGSMSILTECLAEEFKESNIKFNCLALGAVQTEMLKEAFPEYEAPVSANEMAIYIYDFALNGAKFINGKVVSVSSSTP